MTDNPINQKAFDWLVRADAGLSLDEKADLDKWLAVDDRHYGAYVRAQAVLCRAGRIKALSSSPDPSTWAAFIRESEREGSAYVADHSPSSTRISRRALLGGIGGLATIGLGLTLLTRSEPAQALTFETGLGESQNIALADGTNVLLNTNSELRVHLSKTVRAVELVRGEAFCSIARDAHRPFVFAAAGVSVRADHGSFVVQKLDGEPPQILVKNGTVEITPVNATSVKVAANSRITVLPGNRLSGAVLSPEQMERELLWQEGKIAFEDTPVRRAVVAFDRYGPVHIDVRDPALMDQTVTGIFSADDAEGFARMVAELFDARAIRQGSVVVLAR